MQFPACSGNERVSSRRGWVNRFARRSALAMAAASAANSLMSSGVWAVSGTWVNSGNLDYTNPAGWTFGTAPGSLQDVANFTGVDLSAGVTIHVDVASLITLGTLVFGDTNAATAGAWLIETAS